MRKAVAGFAGDQPNAMLALSAEERILLSAFLLPMVTELPAAFEGQTRAEKRRNTRSHCNVGSVCPNDVMLFDSI